MRQGLMPSMLTVAHACSMAAGIFLAATFVMAAALLSPVATAQPAEIDWRSALILRFDPQEGGDGTYLKRVADELESGWIADAGPAAVAVGPIFASARALAQAAPASDIPDNGSEYGAIDPSLGSDDDFALLAAAARQANVPVILHLHTAGAPDAYAHIAAWAVEFGMRHFVLHDGDEEDVRALRAALGAAGVDRGWIAGTSPDAEAAVDAIIENVAATELMDDAALTALYAQAAQRRAASPKPVITSAAVAPTASAELVARLLLHPGALEIVLEHAPNANGSAAWHRIAAFRARHPAIGRGDHVDLANNTFAFGRTSDDPLVDDRIVVVLGASNNTTVNVSRIFPDNTLLSDALTGRTAFVSFGMASFDAGPEGIILIEEIR